MMLDTPRRGAAARLGELALWSSAGLLVLTVHLGAAAYLMRQAPEAPADNGPPAAIMIDLAPEPEAANTEQDQVTPETVDQEEVKTEQTEPVEEPPPEPVEQAEPDPQPDTPPDPVAEPPVEPPPQETAETPPPEPEPPVEPEPTPEPPPVAQTLPEPPPEPIEQPDPIEEQVTAALDNVEVPLPVMRPPPPVVEKPKEAEKPQPKKQREVRRQKQPQKQEAMAEAKLQTRQSDRTAASQTSSGSIFSSVSPATWKSRVQSKLARRAQSCPTGSVGTAVVRFNFDGSGNVTNVSLARSSGNGQVDDYIVSIVRRASPIPAPPAGVPSFLTQALTCNR